MYYLDPSAEYLGVRRGRQRVVQFLSTFLLETWGDPLVRHKEPGYINFERRTGGEPLLEAAGVRAGPGEREFVMVCGMGQRTVWIKWYGRTPDHAREKFREWLSKPWQVLTTDLSGYGVPHGFDFKTARIDWFGVLD